jgi:hypothetical protein
MPQERPFDDLRHTGLLWYLNRTALHPRGYALAIHYNTDPEGNRIGEPTGWSLLGDGTEPWQYAPEIDENEAFNALHELMP